jgi:hypothetical protein
VHSIRIEKEKAEELAEKYVIRLGLEIILAIKKYVEERSLST